MENIQRELNYFLWEIQGISTLYQKNQIHLVFLDVLFYLIILSCNYAYYTHKKLVKFLMIINLYQNQVGSFSWNININCQKSSILNI